MTSQELSNTQHYFANLSNRPLTERLAVIDYISKLFVLLIQFAIAHFIVSGAFRTPSIIRIGLYINCVRIFVAIIKDVFALTRGDRPDNAVGLLESLLGVN